ncbi:AraC family transcriptional regulator [Alteromonas sp. BL110]|uniref:AraC family transcriptional regulator n=1 Tax=Alteromonas sp. BL110 TaxID=1714845 RepID=UPI000E502075|nr:helix-turn-helix domain-containing protein [Alteromonas sp. BL110]AXT38455.1 AraC family transcriptional regulator [Alteromonas sp. BL110]RKM83800.1 helix-turn-helix domain-containing protein [Alteromonas sp. BL110]
MSSVVFNLNDITLVMTIVLSILFSLMLLSSHRMNDNSAYLLAAFLISHAFIAFHELTFFGEKFRFEALEFAPNILFVGSLAYCLDAVLLYFYIKSSVFSDFKFSKKYLVHLIPFFLYAIYLIFNYYSLSDIAKQIVIENWGLYSTWHYVATDTSIKLLRLAYLIGCFVLIARYHKRHKEERADISTIDLNWLRLLLIGFLAIMLTEAFLSILKVINLSYAIEVETFISIGLLSYYITFLLVVSLLFYSVTKSHSIIPIPTTDENQNFDEKSVYKPVYIERIETIMRKEKPYLLSDITIDELAKKLHVSTKDLSVTLNRHFQMNFYEFINNYRIEEAKTLLVEDVNKSITDIYFDVGFNSKSVFYTFFNKKEGITPSEFRKRHSNNS